MTPASEQFHQRAAAFLRANSGMCSLVRGWPVAGSPEHRVVTEWFTYFHVRGQTGTIATFQSILRGNGTVQFPCESPVHFDPSYEPPAHSWREPVVRESRQDVSRVVEATLAGLRKAAPRGRQPVPKSHLAEPQQSPAEWLDDYTSNPPPVPVFSDEFRERFGLRKRDDEAAA